MIDLWVLREVNTTSPGWQVLINMIWLPAVDPLMRNHDRSAP
jgi:hypothetical protein